MTSTEQAPFLDLDRAAIGRPVTRSGISFFPVYLMDNNLPDILPGLYPTVRSIEELPDASVPTLRVVNPTGWTILLVAGEQLVGGDQNRTLNVSVLVPAESDMEVPVSCLEAGRWGRRAEFRSGSTFAHRRVRRAANSAVAQQAGTVQARRGDQSAVWASIDASLDDLDVQAPTSAMADADLVFERDPERYDAAEELAAVGPLPGQCGVVVAHGPRVVAIELFGGSDLLREYWRPLVRSYLLETPTVAGAPSATRVLKALDDASETMSRHSPGLGLGVERHFSNRRAVGQALTLEGALVHASVISR